MSEDYKTQISMDDPYFNKQFLEEIKRMVKAEIKAQANMDKKIPCIVTANQGAYGYVNVSLYGSSTDYADNIVSNVKVANHVAPYYLSEYYATAINGSMTNLLLDTEKQNLHVNSHLSSWIMTSAESPYSVWFWDGAIFLNTTGGSLVLNLPVTNYTHSGHFYIFKRLTAGANTITINGTSGQLIDGLASKTLNTQYDVLRIMSNGTGWSVI